MGCFRGARHALDRFRFGIERMDGHGEIAGLVEADEVADVGNAAAVLLLACRPAVGGPVSSNGSLPTQDGGSRQLGASEQQGQRQT